MLGVTPEMAFFFNLFSNCQSSVGQTKNLMGFVNSSDLSTSCNQRHLSLNQKAPAACAAGMPC